jgi:spore coat protein U-like protein
MSTRKTFSNRVMAGFIMAACLGGLSRPAFAGSADTTFGVTASVAGSCTIAVNDTNFGSYDPSSTIENSDTITYQCTSGLSPTIALDAGQNGGGNPNDRAMSNGTGGLLAYNIYQDVGMTTLWGDGSDGSSLESVSADGGSDTTTAWVSLAAGQTAAPQGSYSDMVTATVSW